MEQVAARPPRHLALMTLHFAVAGRERWVADYTAVSVVAVGWEGGRIESYVWGT
jgi:hypothetical protein